MKKKLQNSTVVIASILATVMLWGVGMFASDGAENYRDGVTYVETCYAGNLYIPNTTLTAIEVLYGKSVKDMYVQAVQTGDYVEVHKAMGWKLSEEVADSYGRSIGYAYVMPSNAMRLETKTYAVVGQYATVQDYLSWCEQYGRDPMKGATTYELVYHNIPGHQITKAEHQAYHKANGSAAAPATGDPKVEALKTYKGNNAEFNAYAYYMRYADLQAAFGPNGDLLLKHYNEHGKKENRIAK